MMQCGYYKSINILNIESIIINLSKMRHAFMLFCVATTVLSLNEVTVDIFIESQCPGCMEFVNT